MTAQQKIVNLAYKQLGYVETATNKTKYAADLDALGDVYNGKKNGFDWCDVFYDWLPITLFGKALGQKLLCQPSKSSGAGCRYSANYYKAAGRFFSEPQPADQIFFVNGDTWTHTGVVVAVKDGMVYTIEGNAGNNADRVVECRYPVGASYIGGYGRPDWSLVPADPVKPAPPSGGTYTVKSGDSWWLIAKKQMGSGSKMNELASANGKTINDVIHPGDVLKIPGKSGGSTQKTYTVKSGDSFWGIAASQMGNGSKMYDLAAANGMTINDVIHPGDVLVIPV